VVQPEELVTDAMRAQSAVYAQIEDPIDRPGGIREASG
jgi:hypothetical protein